MFTLLQILYMNTRQKTIQIFGSTKMCFIFMPTVGVVYNIFNQRYIHLCHHVKALQ